MQLIDCNMLPLHREMLREGREVFVGRSLQSVQQMTVASLTCDAVYLESDEGIARIENSEICDWLFEPIPISTTEH